MIADLGQVAFGFAMPPAVGYAYCRALRKPAAFYVTWMTSGIGGVIGALLPPAAPVNAVSSGASALVAAVLWWLSRRRRKRAPKLAGAKSRAILAAVVRTMRERAKPRPVFRPVPGGAR